MSTTPTPLPVATTVVPVTDPAHPSHRSWLRILLTVLEAATAIGPAVVAVTSPENAALAASLGKIALASETSLDPALQGQQ